jgi:N-acetylneuraminate synthase
VKLPKIKKCIIIAEAGVNHNGQVSIAKKMIREAAKAGADFIKFQTFIPSALVTDSALKADYQKKTVGNRRNQRDMLEKLKLSNKEFVFLRKECKKQKIGFLSTAFDLESLKFIESLQPAFHKISSGDIDNLPLLRQVGRYRRPVILSTGMAGIQDIKTALKILEEAGLQRSKVILVQCHTEYPTPPSQANLKVMDTLRSKFGVPTGLSDHTSGILVSVAAAARGAAVIEKHFTLSRDFSGPDHRASLEPEELQSLVAAIRTVKQALGNGVKRPTSIELKNKVVIRRSLVASRAIRAGEPFTGKNICAKRPATGVSPLHWDRIIGKKAVRDFAPDEPIEI